MNKLLKMAKEEKRRLIHKIESERQDIKTKYTLIDMSNVSIVKLERELTLLKQDMAKL